MELCKTDIYFIILLIFNLFLFYKFYELKNPTKENVKEHFAVQDDVKAAINEVYQADVDAIRNLSAVATKLQAGGLTVAGALTVTEKLWTKGGATGGGGQTHFPFDNGINYIRGQTQQDGDLNVRDNLVVNGRIETNEWLRVNADRGLYFEKFGGGWHMSDTDWIRAYNGKNVYSSGEIRANRMFTEGNLTVNGNISNIRFGTSVTGGGNGGTPGTVRVAFASYGGVMPNSPCVTANAETGIGTAMITVTMSDCNREGVTLSAVLKDGKNGERGGGGFNGTIHWIAISNVNEPFAIQDDVKAAINEIYQADVDAIRNLSAVATKLQAGGLTVAGKLSVTSALTVSGALSVTSPIKGRIMGGVAGYFINDDNGNRDNGYVPIFGSITDYKFVNGHQSRYSYYYYYNYYVLPGYNFEIFANVGYTGVSWNANNYDGVSTKHYTKPNEAGNHIGKSCKVTYKDYNGIVTEIT